MPALLAVPNVSEGRDPARIAAIEQAFAGAARLLDRHSDADHDRSVFTLASPGPASAGGADALVEALASGASAAIEAIDMSSYEGLHPAIGALDVCPVVWADPADRELARDAALAAAEAIGALGVPVFLYGELAAGAERRERAFFRNGGLSELWLRMESGELRPDRGPAEPHPSAGATLVTARPPLAAFNVELDSGDVERRPRGRRRIARVGRRARRRARDRPRPGQRPHPGLDQRPRPAAPRRWRGSSSGSPSSPRRSAPGRSRPS